MPRTPFKQTGNVSQSDEGAGDVSASKPVSSGKAKRFLCSPGKGLFKNAKNPDLLLSPAQQSSDEIRRLHADINVDLGPEVPMQLSSAESSLTLKQSTPAAQAVSEPSAPCSSSVQVEETEEKKPARARASDAHMGLQTFLSPSKTRKPKAEVPSNGAVRRSTRQAKTEPQAPAQEEGIARSNPRRAAAKASVASVPPPEALPSPPARTEEDSVPDTVDLPAEIQAEVCEAVSTAAEEAKEKAGKPEARRSSTRASGRRKSVKEESKSKKAMPEPEMEEVEPAKDAEEEGVASCALSPTTSSPASDCHPELHLPQVIDKVSNKVLHPRKTPTKQRRSKTTPAPVQDDPAPLPAADPQQEEEEEEEEPVILRVRRTPRKSPRSRAVQSSDEDEEEEEGKKAGAVPTQRVRVRESSSSSRQSDAKKRKLSVEAERGIEAEEEEQQVVGAAEEEDVEEVEQVVDEGRARGLGADMVCAVAVAVLWAVVARSEYAIYLFTW